MSELKWQILQLEDLLESLFRLTMYLFLGKIVLHAGTEQLKQA